MGRPAVFLDRDGVLNRAFERDGVPVPPRTLDEFEVLPGVAEACAAFRAAGLLLVVVTNQPDLARGTLDPTLLQAFHDKLRAEVPVDDIVVCPHSGHEGCWCRKPRPGMILDAARRHGVDLDRSVAAGDRWRDVDAAHRAGVSSVWIDWGLGEPLRDAPGARFGSLAQAREYVLEVCGAPRA
ncbi:HAD-IIIA family hydrolase [Nocardioides anomalus]|uniref:D,D-heptose 1,7-bisphosphate phosphatase n=1 Tax=Nocardioides anomalus TaxID=2712223 RepID=A0A6G6WHT4_9ACTN|nr:HAD-IIIA family hydrolase [Nocardioides anomalus]QIG44782.1 HAD-IIIA family hydrolase [Nocardioides anomalus]